MAAILRNGSSSTIRQLTTSYSRLSSQSKRYASTYTVDNHLTTTSEPLTGSQEPNNDQGEQSTASFEKDEFDPSVLPEKWAERVHARRKRKMLVDMFTPLGSTQNKDTTFQPFHTLNRPIGPSELTISALMAAGAHLGHTKQRTRSTYLPYIYGRRANVNIIDLDHTLAMFRRAANFVRLLAQQGGTILFVGTDVDGIRKAARRASERVGQRSFHVSNEWVPGTFTNAGTMLGDEIYEGDYLPDCAIFLNPKQNLGPIRECHTAMIPTIGIVDTDTDPRIVTYAIPANDESLRTVELIAGVLSVAAREGQKRAQEEAKRLEEAAKRAGETTQFEYQRQWEYERPPHMQ